VVISVVQLGRVDYASATRLQQTLVELRKQGRITDTLLLLEHPPVITLGRNATRKNVIASDEQMQRTGVEIFECDRGGDVTYHGPGQLVGYPIFDLRDRPKRMGAVDYVRHIEEALIRTCADYGVAARRVKGLTGVWTFDHEAKIAAIGVHISRGVTSHGFALNVTTDLDHFKLIVPCGIADKPVTSLHKAIAELDPGRATPSSDDVATVVVRNFGKVFESQILWVDTLDALVGRTVGVPLKAPAELKAMHGNDTSLA
jgi:lipoyl(octanoyl) transferase